jgi:hypothetical protein
MPTHFHAVSLKALVASAYYDHALGMKGDKDWDDEKRVWYRYDLNAEAREVELSEETFLERWEVRCVCVSVCVCVCMCVLSSRQCFEVLSQNASLLRSPRTCRTHVRTNA